MRFFSGKVLLVLICWIMIILGLEILFMFLLPLVLGMSVFLVGRDSLDEHQTFGVGLISVWIGWILSPLSLIPSYFICMKMAKWLREKRGWPIYHPRKLFAISILLPVGLITLFVIASALTQ